MLPLRQQTTFTGALVLFLLLLPLTALGQFQLGKVGIGGGANFQQVDDLSGTASFENATQYHVGVFYDQPFDLPTGTLAVRPGFVFRSVGTYQFAGELPEPNAFSLAGRSFDVYALSFPLDLRYQLDLETTSPYIVAGPSVSILRAEQDFEAALEDAMFSANVGLGTEFTIESAAGIVVAPEVRYGFGITNAVKDEFTLRFRSITTSEPAFNGLGVRLHVYYPL